MSQPQQTAEQHEQEQVRDRTAIRAQVVYDAIEQEGRDELDRPSIGLLWSGLAAGLSMGFSLLTEALIQQHLPDAPWRPLISKLGYGAGFLIVILGRQQLFTENTLTVILPLLRDFRKSLLLNVLRLWIIVLLANLVGTLLFALTLGRTPVVDDALRVHLSEIGHAAMAHGFGGMFMRAIFAGWLIALMVWLLPFAEASRLFVIVIITWVVGVAGFAHSIAGATETLYLVVTGESSAAAFLGRFLLPTLAGNIVGGVSLVALLNHAQVTAGADDDQA